MPTVRLRTALLALLAFSVFGILPTSMVAADSNDPLNLEPADEDDRGARVDNMVPTRTYPEPCDAAGGTISNRGTVCQTDNADVYYYMDSVGDYELESEDRVTVRNMIADQYQRTDLDFSYDSTPDFRGSGETDIIYQEGTVPGSSEGVAYCNNVAGGYRCDQYYVRIEGGGFYTPGLSCHETGHAVGLLHGAQSNPVQGQTASVLGCMRTPVSTTSGLGGNQRANINSTY